MPNGSDAVATALDELAALGTDRDREQLGTVRGRLDEARLRVLVTERGNPGNRRGIAGVTVYLDAPVLAAGVALVDTPGTGSVFEWDTEAAHAALESMDAAIFVLTADPPVSASERDLLDPAPAPGVSTPGRLE